MPERKKQKILYLITQGEYGGAQRYVFDLAKNLMPDYDTAVAFGRENNQTFAKILHDHNIKTFILPRLKRSISPINDLLALFEIISLIKKFQPDIVHLNSSKISILGSLAALRVTRYALRVIYTVHGWVFNEPLPWLLKKFYFYAEKFTARFKDKIICVSEHDRQAALKLKIAPADKLVTIHNGLEPINFYTKEEARKNISNVVLERRPLVCHTGLDPASIRRDEVNPKNSGLRVKPAMTNNFLIGSIGNLYKTKGYEYLIKAADILINRGHLPATFIIIGEGGERLRLEKLIKHYHLEENIILTGPIDNAAALLHAFDIYVCSSVKEGFPYSVLEAMRAGLPIVSTNVGGITEMIEDEKTGLIARPADAKDLAEKINTLLKNKELAEELGLRAKSRAETEFNLEKMLEQTKKAY